MDIHNYQSLSEGDISRYLVDSPLEIERILRGMMEQKTLISGIGNKSKRAFMTTVLGVDGASRQFFLESPQDGHMDDDLLVKDGAAFSARHQNVQIQFVAGLGKQLQHEGRPAYRLPFPGQFLRFQRREFYRVEVPRATPSKCRFTLANQRTVESVVADISIGGIGLTYKPADAEIALGQVIHGCRLLIPEVGEFVVSLKVRNQVDLVLRNGEHVWRVGCEFIDLPSIVERELQRYIFKIERERHAQAK